MPGQGEGSLHVEENREIEIVVKQESEEAELSSFLLQSSREFH